MHNGHAENKDMRTTKSTPGLMVGILMLHFGALVTSKCKQVSLWRHVFDWVSENVRIQNTINLTIPIKCGPRRVTKRIQVPVDKRVCDARFEGGNMEDSPLNTGYKYRRTTGHPSGRISRSSQSTRFRRSQFV